MQLFVMGTAFGCMIAAVLMFALIAMLDGRPMLLKYLPLVGGGMLLYGAGNGWIWFAILGLMVEVGGYIAAIKWPIARQPA